MWSLAGASPQTLRRDGELRVERIPTVKRDAFHAFVRALWHEAARYSNSRDNPHSFRATVARIVRFDLIGYRQFSAEAAQG